MSLRDKCGFEFWDKTEMFRSTDSKVATGDYLDQSRSEIESWTSNAGQPLVPTREEVAILSPFERFAFRVTHRMNQGSWKRFCTWCQSVFGAGWIHLSSYNLVRVYGLENVEAVDPARAIFLASNHRSLFDFYLLSHAFVY